MAMSENQRDPQYKLRWPEDLRDKIMISAKTNNRSINAEICARLEQSFKHQDDLIAIAQTTSYSVRNSLEAMQAALDRIMKLQSELDEKSEQIKKLTEKSKN